MLSSQLVVLRVVPASQSELTQILGPEGVPEQGFPRRARLVKTDEFSSVFNFRKRISGQHLAAYYKPSPQPNARLGLIVGKKVAAAAVDRNYMRRVLRELFRVQQSGLAGLDIVIRVQHRFDRKDYLMIKQEFLGLADKLARTRARLPPNG